MIAQNAESARGFSPEPLTDPDVNLSIHPARATTEGCRILSKEGVPPVAR